MQCNEKLLRIFKKKSEIVLISGGYGPAPLGLLHHVSLVAQAYADHGGLEAARLPIYLHGDGLVCDELHTLTLAQPLAVTTHL